jgi:hypothetical protein
MRLRRGFEVVAAADPAGKQIPVALPRRFWYFKF